MTGPGRLNPRYPESPLKRGSGRGIPGNTRRDSPFTRKPPKRVMRVIGGSPEALSKPRISNNREPLPWR